MFVPFSPITVVILFFVAIYAIYEHLKGKYNELMIEIEKSRKIHEEREARERKEKEYARRQFIETLKKYQDIKGDL